MLLVVAFLLLWSAVPAVAAEPGAEPHVLQVRVVTDEADAALAILDERARTGAVEPGSWERLWKSEGFVRLKKRSESFGAKDVEQGFRDFLTSGEPLSHARELRQALETWKHLDATAAARRAGAYLPPGIPLRVTIYPVIKTGAPRRLQRGGGGASEGRWGGVGDLEPGVSGGAHPCCSVGRTRTSLIAIRRGRVTMKAMVSAMSSDFMRSMLAKRCIAC
jgi:hypothetical protein